MVHPVIKFPEKPTVLDFTPGSTNRFLDARFTIGRYNENREGMYEQDLFKKEKRFFHIGIDLGAPAGTEVFSFAHGQIINMGINEAPGDYGPTLITQHDWDGKPLYVLWGHLSRKSLERKVIGQMIREGEVIGWLGNDKENGGWPPHLHFQLSWTRPSLADMPGVVTRSELSEALKNYPDPRLVLGPIYE